MRLTNNFTFEELTHSDTAVRNKINNTPDEWSEVNLVKLATSVLQPIRDSWGKPIVVSSGFRCQTLNTKLGGANNSDHKYGAAADIHALPNDKASNKELYNTIVQMANEGKIRCRQIINEFDYSWIHVSVNHPKNTEKYNELLTIN